MINLDDVQALKRSDSTNLLGALRDIPEQFAKAWQLAGQVELPRLQKLSNIMVAGIDESALGGELLRVFCHSRLPVPVLVNRDYVLPEFAGKDTLVFVTSYSGNNEVTISAYEEARLKGAFVTVITGGGKLKEKALSDGVQVVTIPGEISPRAAVGYLFLPMLSVLQRLSLLGELSGEIADVVSHLKIIRERFKPEVPERENRAKQLARLLYNRIPMIWGCGGTTGAAARRFKEQINKNAGVPAYWNLFPQLNFDELWGLQFPKELLKKIYVIILRDPYDHPRVQRGMEIARGMVEQEVAGVSEIHASGSTTLARIFSLIYTGDYTGVYLAALYGVDPDPRKALDFLTAEPAK